MKYFFVFCMLISALNAGEIMDKTEDFFTGMWIALPFFMLSAILLYARNKEERRQANDSDSEQSETTRF